MGCCHHHFVERLIGFVHLQGICHRTVGFVQHQTHNFKVMLVRRASHEVAANLSAQYNAIYATLLGASPVQLGSLQSAGNAIGALAALPVGWSVDNYGLKKVFLLGTAILTVSGLLYFVAPYWAWLYAGIILFYLGSRITCTTCTVTCAAALPNKERATGRGLCRTISSSVGIVTPLLAAWLISEFGGITARSIRSLYMIQVLIFVGIFVLLWTQLSGSKASGASSDGRDILSSFLPVLKRGPDVIRLMLVIGLMELPWSLTQPFMPVYAHQIKGANEFMLGGIAVAISIVPMLASIPLGRLADEYGRKKLLFAIAPLAYVANLCLVFAPVSGTGRWVFLLLYGILFGFNSISMAVASSMTAEIMPEELMGRWIGMISLVRGLIAVPAPLIAGLVWEHIGPEYVFLGAIAIDVFLRLPLLASVRETLHLSLSEHSER